MAPQSIIDYSDISTMHGLKQLVSAGIIRRLIWSAILIGCITVFCVQISHKIILWQSEPIITNIQVEYPAKLHFPQILLCNDNLFKITYTHDNLYYMISDIYGTGSTGKLNYHVNFTKYETDFNEVDNNDSLEFMKSASSQLEEMLIYCAKPDGTRCTAADFKVVPTDFGICYAFNSDIHNPVFIGSEGFSNGLYLIINIEGYERTPGNVNTLGLKIVIINQTSYPFTKLEGINVPPGYETNLGLSYKVSTKIHVNHSGTCITEMPLPYMQTDMYSINRCKMNLMIREIIKKCGCSPFYAPKSPNLPICGVRQHFTCAVYANKIPHDASTCKANCTDAQYKAFLSMTKLPPNFLEYTVSKKAADDIYEKYLWASEIRERVQIDKMRENQKLISNLKNADDVLRSYSFAPVVENFTPTFKRLLNNASNSLSTYSAFRTSVLILVPYMVPCFSEIVNDTEETILRNVAWKHLKDKFHHLLYNEKILSVLHPELTVEELIMNDDNLTKTYSEEINAARDKLRSALQSLDTMLKSFRSWKYVTELPTTIKEYVEVFNLLDEYESGNITKLQWAARASQLRRMMAQFTTFINAVSANVVAKLNQPFHSAEVTNASTVLDEILMDPDPSIKTLLVELIFANFKNESCVEAHEPLSDLFNEMYKNSTMAYYPDLIDKPDRIIALCPSISQKNISDLITKVNSCVFGDLRNVSMEINEIITNLSTILSDPFDELQNELHAYEWFLKKGTRVFEDNILSLNIYLQDLSIEKVTQEHSYDTWSLLCDIGGSMGLFIGASVVTVFEMFDFFMLKPLLHREEKKNTKTEYQNFSFSNGTGKTDERKEMTSF